MHPLRLLNELLYCLSCHNYLLSATFPTSPLIRAKIGRFSHVIVRLLRESFHRRNVIAKLFLGKTINALTKSGDYSQQVQTLCLCQFRYRDISPEYPHRKGICYSTCEQLI